MTDVFEWRDAPQAEYAVIGDPVSHSWSPRMQNAAFESLGIPARYVALRVPPEELDVAMAHLITLGYVGVNVTVPLKELAYRWVRYSDDTCRRLRAVNTVSLHNRWGSNTDAPGFMDTVRELGIEPGACVLVLGAGGTARAVVLALCDAGYGVDIYNRTPLNAVRMLGDLNVRAAIMEYPDPRQADLIVNTTSAGLSGESIGVEWDLARPEAIAYDAMYSREPTMFLREAADAGLQTVDGRGLLVAQGARSLEWWRGIRAPRDVMREVLG